MRGRHTCTTTVAVAVNGVWTLTTAINPGIATGIVPLLLNCILLSLHCGYNATSQQDLVLHTVWNLHIKQSWLTAYLSLAALNTAEIFLFSR